MRRRQFLGSATATGALHATCNFIPLISSANAAIPGTVTWGGAYLLDETTTDMPYTKAALAMNASSSPTGQSVNRALLDAIRVAGKVFIPRGICFIPREHPSGVAILGCFQRQRQRAVRVVGVPLRRRLAEHPDRVGDLALGVRHRLRLHRIHRIHRS